MRAEFNCCSSCCSIQDDKVKLITARVRQLRQSMNENFRARVVKLSETVAVYRIWVQRREAMKRRSIQQVRHPRQQQREIQRYKQDKLVRTLPKR